MYFPRVSPIYAVVAKDSAGLYYTIRSEEEVLQVGRIVRIFKGQLVPNLQKKAEQFIEENKRKRIRTLNQKEITSLLH